MTVTENTVRVALLQDGTGGWYVLPAELAAQFRVDAETAAALQDRGEEVEGYVLLSLFPPTGIYSAQYRPPPPCAQLHYTPDGSLIGGKQAYDAWQYYIKYGHCP